MKKPQFKIETLHKFCVRTLFLMVSVLPILVNAQDGRNDASFNKADNLASQGANNTVNVSVIQPDNKIIIAGNFTKYNGATANKIARLNSNGKLDKTFNAGLAVNGSISTIAIQSNNKILIGGRFNFYNGTQVNNMVRLNSNGTLDHSFPRAFGWKDGISTLIIQPDGKVLVAGVFVNGFDTIVKKLIRLNTDGTEDETFTAILTDTLVTIEQIALQPDGKILVAGREKASFRDSKIIIRLNNNGARDVSFAPYHFDFGDIRATIKSIAVEKDGNILLAGTNYDGVSSYHGFLLRLDSSGKFLALKYNFWINEMIVQNDGKIILAGMEGIDSWSIKRKIVRINRDLTLDSTFIYNDQKVYQSSVDACIQTIALQYTGKIVAGGDFYESSGLIANHITRLNVNGSPDYSFNERSGCNGTILTSAVQTDGKIIIGGEFSTFNSKLRSNLARLKKNGSLDNTFNVGKGTNGIVYASAIQPDGKIIIGGSFTSYNGNNCHNIARLNTNGSFDAAFATAATDNIVRKIVIASDGKIIIGGDFEHVNGIAKNALARLLTNGHLDNTFNPVIDNYNNVYDCKISSNGMIYIAVNPKALIFVLYGAKILRLNNNGNLDTTFNIKPGRFHELHAISFSNDGKILVGGRGKYLNFPFSFYDYDGIITKLNLDGSLDSSFDYLSLEYYLKGTVKTINVLTNNKIMIGGDFVYGGGSLMNHIGLLNSDASIDYDFTGTADQNIYTTAPVEGNKMIIAGSFGEYTGIIRNSIARIYMEETKNAERSQPLALSQKITDATLKVYPNPATSAITIENMGSGSIVKIFNSMGEEIYSGIVTNEKSILELSNYSNGVYFIIAENNGNRTTAKFIVNK